MLRRPTHLKSAQRIDTGPLIIDSIKIRFMCKFNGNKKKNRKKVTD